MYYVYVLKSIRNETLYIGMTSHVLRRLEEHNSGKVQSTKPHRPYQLLYSESFLDKTTALRREKQIKRSGKIRQELKNGTYLPPSSSPV